MSQLQNNVELLLSKNNYVAQIELPGLKAWDCIDRGGDSNPSPLVFLKNSALKGGVSSLEDERHFLAEAPAVQENSFSANQLDDIRR